MEFGKTALKWLGWNENDAKTIRERRQAIIDNARVDPVDREPTRPVGMFFKGLLGEDDPDRNLPSVMAGVGTNAEWMARKSREAITAKQDKAHKAGRMFGLGVDASDVLPVMGAAGTLVRASAEQVRAAKALMKAGAPKEEVWKTVKAWQAPSGDWVTERTFDIQSVDRSQLGTDVLNMKEFDDAFSYTTDMTPQEKAIVQGIKTTGVPPHLPAARASVTQTDSGEIRMGLRPTVPDIETDVYHEIGHAVRGAQNLPVPIGPQDAQDILPVLESRAQIAAAVLREKMNGGGQLPQVLAQLQASNSPNYDMVLAYSNLPTKELYAEVDRIVRLVDGMKSKSGPLDFYKDQQDELFARLDEVRSPWSDEMQRATPPWETAPLLTVPSDPNATNVVDWKRVLKRLEEPKPVGPRTRMYEVTDLFDDPFKSTLD